ncbi:MAG: hypothetical protein NTV43_13335 [Methylococcales bacterium]|nr:hypothetical protein [Methylococcales bacterium]
MPTLAIPDFLHDAHSSNYSRTVYLRMGISEVLATYVPQKRADD